MINLTETGVFPLETPGLYSTVLVHNFFHPGRMGNLAGSEVTHRPTKAEINRCRVCYFVLAGRKPRIRPVNCAHMKSLQICMFNPSNLETGLFHNNWSLIIAADDLAPCVSRPSAAMVLTHWGRDKMAAIFHTFSIGFHWMKMYEFRLTFHWSLILGVQLTIFQYWFR